MATMVRVLGDVAVATDATVVSVPDGRQAEILSHLAAAGTLRTDELIDRVWDGDAPKTARAALQVHLSKLRRALGDAGASDPVETLAGAYRLAPGVTVDADQFVREVAAARAAEDPISRLAMVRGALDRWHGPPYAAVADSPAIVAHAARLLETAVQARQLFVETLLDLGRPEEAITEAEVLTRLDPLRERPIELLMLARYRAGDPSGALRAFGRLRADLADRFGTEPGPAIRALEERMLFGDPDLLDPDRRPAPAHNLPPDVRLVGRGAELDAVEAALAAGRVVVITGPPGVGKSAVAVAAAHRRLGDHPAGSHWVDGATVASADEARSRLSSAPWAIGVDVEQRLRSIGRSPGLVLVDDADDVDLGSTLSEVIAGGRAAVLVTASTPPQLPYAHVVRLAPLAVPRAEAPDTEIRANPSVRLLVERLSSDVQALLDDDRQLGRLAEVARMADGLPFALELIAGWLPVVGLGDDLPVVTGDPVAMAVARLGEPERTVLRALAHFVGWVPAEAIAATTPGLADGDRLMALRSVVSGSLAISRLGSDGRAVYRLLAPVRAHVLAGAIDDGRSALRDEWLGRWTVKVRSATASPQEAQAFAATEALLPDLEAHWSRRIAAGDREPVAVGVSSMWRFWFSTFRVEAGIHWLEAALDGPLPPDVEAAAANTLGWLTWLDDRTEQAVPILDRAARAALRADDRERLGLVDHDLGRVLVSAGQREEGSARLAEARHLLDEVGHAHGSASCRAQLAAVALGDDDLETAVELAVEAERLAADVGDPSLLGDVDWTLGHIYRRQGHLVAAAERGRRVLAAAERIGSQPLRCSGRFLLAHVAADDGDPLAAADHLRDAAAVLPRRSEIDMARLLLTATPTLLLIGEVELASLAAARVRRVYGDQLRQLVGRDALAGVPPDDGLVPPSTQELVDRVVAALG